MHRHRATRDDERALRARHRSGHDHDEPRACGPDRVQRALRHAARSSADGDGSEEGYVLAVAELAALCCPRPRLEVHVFDLGYDDIDGLLGLNFLRELNYEVRSAERRILVEVIEPAAPLLS